MKVEKIVFLLVIIGLVGIGVNTIRAVDHLKSQFEKENLRRNGHSYTHDR